MRILLVDATHIFGTIFSASDQANKPNVSDFFKTCANSVKKAIKELQPEYVLVALDDYRSSWRVTQNSNYHVSSFGANIAYINQLSIFTDEMKKSNIQCLSMPKMEGKDVVATICKKMDANPDAKIYILSSSKRYYPILRNGIVLRNHFGKDSALIEKTSEKLFLDTGLCPEQLHGVYLLSGEKVIGLDGVKGIGEKTAIDIMKSYRDVRDLIDNAYKIEGKKGESIRLALPGIFNDFSEIIMPKSDLQLGISLSKLKYNKPVGKQADLAYSR
ncbi:DNA polymerase I, thermostable [compost metagenome]